MTRAEYLVEQAGKRVLVLDGAMGTMIQKISGAEHPFGCNELLNLTESSLIYDIHLSYLRAGADIIETNTFGANAFSLAEYGLSDSVYDINLAAVEIARAAVEAIEEEDVNRYAFIAGVLGPTGKSLSLSPSVDNPAFRDVSFDDFVSLYTEQVEALLDGGVDVILIETVFDTLVAKAALVATMNVCETRSVSIPIMVSATFSDKSARTLSGQTLEAFVSSLSSYPLFSLGINCSTGAKEMVPLIQKLAQCSPFRTSAHPNAGFPDQEGQYLQTPEDFVRLLEPELSAGRLNIVGGCCGTTEHHISALVSCAKKGKIRPFPDNHQIILASGLEPLKELDFQTYITIGERTNVAGSRKFARLIKEKNFRQALSIARNQVEQGALVIDICMDDPLIDPVEAMITFLRLAGAEPEIARVPFMIDSSNWEVVETALKEIQGRPIVNSISLKEGEEQFLSRASYIARMGAAMVVMLFDEEGQADTYERKCVIAERAYSLLIDHGICSPEAIIFDPNVLAIATGIDEHDGYARDFIQAVSWIHSRFPRVSISGGVSNLSFSFRGNNSLREAIHAIFLDYAVKSGLRMAIVNPTTRVEISSIPEKAATIIRRALLAESKNPIDDREALIEIAELPIWSSDSHKNKKKELNNLWRELPVTERLKHALLVGDDSYLLDDLKEAHHIDAVSIIEGPLMDGMNRVGTLFGEGKLFLPQVVRSARVMKRAVDFLRPRLEIESTGKENSSGTVVLATVHGDVHDIGKNIVSLVLTCNNFTIIDLGVMVSAQDILDAAISHNASIVGLSGLITPSLSEMATICRLFQEHNLPTPIMIGGATTSEEHTAIKLEPLYPGRVFHSTDASHAVLVARKLVSHERIAYKQKVAEKFHQIRSTRNSQDKAQIVSLDEARSQKFIKTLPAPMPVSSGIHVLKTVPLETLIQRINWNMVASAWKVPIKSSEAETLRQDAENLLILPEIRTLFSQAFGAVVGLFPARKIGSESIAVIHGDSTTKFDFLRMQTQGRDGLYRSFADYIHDTEVDTIGMFVASAGLGVDTVISQYRESGDDYRALLVGMLADRLAESLSGYLESMLSDTWWEHRGTPSIRPAIGYPSVPDHEQKRQIFSLLGAEERIGVELTEGLSMRPAASVCGFYFVGAGCDYFSLGPIGTDQLECYAHYKQVSSENLEKTMAYTLSTQMKSHNEG